MGIKTIAPGRHLHNIHPSAKRRAARRTNRREQTSNYSRHNTHIGNGRRVVNPDARARLIVGFFRANYGVSALQLFYFVQRNGIQYSYS